MGPTLEEGLAIQLADVGAARILPVIMKFYHADPKETSRLVVDVMDRFGSPISGPHEAFGLAHGIKSIITNDPRLAIGVYRRFFAYNETREDKTAIGGSLIMPLTHTRRQDFSTARSVLLQAFATFLQSPHLRQRERQSNQSTERLSESAIPKAGVSKSQSFRSNSAGEKLGIAPISVKFGMAEAEDTKASNC